VFQPICHAKAKVFVDFFAYLIGIEVDAGEFPCQCGSKSGFTSAGQAHD
jgi:hypothetical protein